MRLSLARLAVVAGLALAAATPALAQRREEYVECYRDGRRVTCESTRAERDRERERALERAREVREQAQERAREARQRVEESRRRTIERQRDLQRQREDERRRSIERQREVIREQRRPYPVRRSYRDETRTTIGFGGGADIRRFADVNRYFGNVGVDFRTRSGIGIRPEVVYGWTDRQRQFLPAFISTCPQCSSIPPIVTNTAPVEFRSRSQMLGVNFNATYTFLRGSAIRPYMLGGVGVISTRENRPEIVTSIPLGTSPTFSQVTYRPSPSDRIDLGLNAGSGLEFGRGPVRLYVEFRYFLNDTATPLGFSGALPITAGLRF
jgi:hypothetical protein